MNVGVSNHKFQRAETFDKVKNEGISFCMEQTGTVFIQIKYWRILHFETSVTRIIFFFRQNEQIWFTKFSA